MRTNIAYFRVQICNNARCQIKYAISNIKCKMNNEAKLRPIILGENLK